MRVEYHQGREVCERCGAYIKHVYVVTFDDGFTVRCGSECVKRVLKDTNLTDRGAKFLQAQMKRVKMITERAELWRGFTYETAAAAGKLARVQRPDGRWTFWTEEEFEAHRDRLVNRYTPHELAQIDAELAKRLKGVKIKR